MVYLKGRKTQVLLRITDWFNDFEKGNDGKHITIGCLGQDCLDFGIIVL